MDGKTIEFNADTLPVYDIVEKAKANELDDDDGDLALKTGESYIVYAVKSKAVYAIHVDTTKASDTKALYDAIVADATVVPVVSNYDAVMAQLAKYDAAADITDDDALKAAKDALTDAAKITKNDVTAAEWDALQTAIGKTQAAVNAYAAADKLAERRRERRARKSPAERTYKQRVERHIAHAGGHGHIEPQLRLLRRGK